MVLRFRLIPAGGSSLREPLGAGALRLNLKGKAEVSRNQISGGGQKAGMTDKVLKLRAS